MAVVSIKSGVKSRSLLVGNAYFQPTSFESIATVVGDGTSTTLTFSSIPSTYKHLQIRGISNDNNGSQVKIRFNSDTGTNYAYHYISGNGTSVTPDGIASASWMSYMAFASGNTNVMGTSVIDVLDYSSITKNKTVRSFQGYDANGSGSIYSSSGLWINTNAVTSISLISSFAFLSSSKFSLYGITG